MNEFLLSTLRVSTPILFAAMGGFFSERSGVINIALEGFMLIGSFFAAAIAVKTGSPWVAFFGAGLVTMVFSSLYAVAAVRYAANQIVAGTAMNLLAMGLTAFFCKAFYDSTGSSPSLELAQRFSFEPLIFVVATVLVVRFLSESTRFGLHLKFAGEEPKSLHSVGASVARVRFLAVMLSGFLAGLGGASLSIFLSSSYSKNMTAGRGFIALSALIFGKWRPIPTAFACLLFGAAEAIQVRVQGIVLWGETKVPVQFIQMVPYLLTIVVLAGFVGRSMAPRALGQPFKS